MSRPRVGLFLVAGLTALVLLGTVDRAISNTGSSGRVFDAKTVEVGRPADQPVVVDGDWVVTERVAKFRDVVVAIAVESFVLPVVGGGLLVWTVAVWPGRSWRAARRGRAPPARQLLAV